MKTFEKKVEELAKLRDKLGRSRLTVFTSFARAGEKGLNVTEMRDLKKKLRDSEGEYLVSKKTLLNKALSNYDVFNFPGSLGLAFGFSDEAVVARDLYSFAKKNPALKFFGALLGGRFIDDEQFIELAKLPARDVMIGRVVGMIRYPLSGLMNVLQGNIRNLVGVLSQITVNRKQ